MEARTAPPFIEERVMGSTMDKIKGMANTVACNIKRGIDKVVGSEKMKDSGNKNKAADTTNKKL